MGSGELAANLSAIVLGIPLIMTLRKGTKVLVTAACVVGVLLAITFYRSQIFIGIARLDPQAIWETAYFHLGNVAVTPELLAQATIFLLLLTFATRLVEKFLRREILARTSLNEGQRYAIERAVGYAVFALGLLIGLQITGLNLNSLAFLGGAVGIGIGFGLQNIANNFASGLILLLERPIKVGDRIDVGNLNGDVIRIGGRSTWVRTNDNLIIIVPNAEFTTNRVTNWTANDRQVRFAFPVGVAYGSDLEVVRKLLLEIAMQHPDVMLEPPAEVLVISLGDSSINLEVRVWTTNQVRTPNRLKSDLYFEIVRLFSAHSIEIPFPHRDIRIKSDVPAELGQNSTSATA